MACFTWFHCDQNQRVAMFATPSKVPEGRPSSHAHSLALSSRLWQVIMLGRSLLAALPSSVAFFFLRFMPLAVDRET